MKGKQVWSCLRALAVEDYILERVMDPVNSGNPQMMMVGSKICDSKLSRLKDMDVGEEQADSDFRDVIDKLVELQGVDAVRGLPLISDHKAHRDYMAEKYPLKEIEG